MNTIKLKSMLEQFYIEDIGDGDLSSDYLFPESCSWRIVDLSQKWMASFVAIKSLNMDCALSMHVNSRQSCGRRRFD